MATALKEDLDMKSRKRLGSVFACLIALGAAGCGMEVAGPSDSDESANDGEPTRNVQQGLAGGRFGTWCQKDFQNYWVTSLPHAWEVCGWFNDELNDTDQQIFYFDLYNKQYYWEQFGDHQAANDSADDVDLLFVDTHGRADPDKAVFATWNQDVNARTNNMRLGDSAWWGGGLAIMATYACYTHKFNDNLLWTRWNSAFRGGLKIALGSHDTVYDGTTTNEVGEDFADNMQHSAILSLAWRDAVSDAYSDEDATIIATGVNQANCETRRGLMRWQDFGNYPFIRDNSIGWVCWQAWDNL